MLRLMMGDPVCPVRCLKLEHVTGTRRPDWGGPLGEFVIFVVSTSLHSAVLDPLRPTGACSCSAPGPHSRGGVVSAKILPAFAAFVA